MKHTIFLFLLLSVVLISAAKNSNVQTTYHWHLQQPIYWPAPNPSNPINYQYAYESMELQNKQGGHPESNLANIFGKPDRVAVYQYIAANAIDSCSNYADMGASVSYSGCLIENVNSFASHGNWGGYATNWNSTYAKERQKTTSGGFPKLDLISFGYHHVIGGLVDKNALAMEIAIHKVIYANTWGTGGANYSKGFFPAEMAFSERMVKTLVEAGIEWVIVPNNHLSRSCIDYPYNPSGDNINPPNKADQVNPNQTDYFRESVSRGVTPNNAYPFSYTPHYVKYVDPATNKEYKIVVVPSAMAMSWVDSCECYGTQDIQSIASKNNPEHPMLILLAHDGDNDFSGGYTYYTSCVNQFVSQAASNGFNPTTVQQYLNDFPVDPNDIIHVEDGAWINPDCDFGSPQFIQWNWPLTGNGSAPDYNITNGWQIDERNWAVITAGQNFVETAEQYIGKPVRPEQVQKPIQGVANEAEIAWHFYLPSMTSGYMYYGAILDMPIKQSIAVNEAIKHAQNAINGSQAKDTTPPSVWYLMRYPYNPGSYEMGCLSNWKYTLMNTSFYVYTFAFDVSGINSVRLFYRVDNDGFNPVNDNANEVYEPEKFGLKGVGNWSSIPMTQRVFPKTCQYGISCDPLPNYIADEYYAKVDGFNNTLIDYYVQATDVFGNVKNTDIYHVWVGKNNNLDINTQKILNSKKNNNK